MISHLYIFFGIEKWRWRESIDSNLIWRLRCVQQYPTISDQYPNCVAKTLPGCGNGELSAFTKRWFRAIRGPRPRKPHSSYSIGFYQGVSLFPWESPQEMIYAFLWNWGRVKLLKVRRQGGPCTETTWKRYRTREWVSMLKSFLNCTLCVCIITVSIRNARIRALYWND